jgi:hypothetical protein
MADGMKASMGNFLRSRQSTDCETDKAHDDATWFLQ